MAYLDHVEELRTSHRRRLQKLEEKHAKLGVSIDPSILIEIEDIKKELAQLDAAPGAHSKLLDLFAQYENGFDHLLHQLGKNARRNEALEYQQRMSANIERVRESGDSSSDSAERERLMEHINALTKQTLNKNFNYLMRRPARRTTGRASTLPPSSAAPARSAGNSNTSITSIQNQNNVTGDHNSINNASYQNIFLGPVGSVSDDSE